MNKLFAIINPILLFSSISYCQNVTIKGTVVNKKKGEVIPFVSIQIIQAKKYFDSDDSGNFLFESEITDSVVFSCIGYEDIRLPIKDLVISSKIELIEKVYLLKDVIVSNKKPQIIGIISERQTRSFSGENESDSYEIVTRISFSDTPQRCTINKVFFKQRNFDPENPLRLHIYEISENGLPGVEVLTAQVILKKEDNVNGQLEIDVTDQNIIIEGKGFYVGIQWINSSVGKQVKGIKSDTGIGETNQISERLTYHRGKIFEHEWFGFYDKGMYFPPSLENKIGKKLPPVSGNPINMLAAAEITIL